MCNYSWRVFKYRKDNNTYSRVMFLFRAIEAGLLSVEFRPHMLGMRPETP